MKPEGQDVGYGDSCIMQNKKSKIWKLWLDSPSTSSGLESATGDNFFGVSK